jgi:N-acetylmuramoyl-L-alanine amidase
MTAIDLAPDFNLYGAFPFASLDDADSSPKARTLVAAPFLYVGRALTREEFALYVKDYAFGPIPPAYVVFHHTAIPSTRDAPWPADTAQWDAHEGGLTEMQIKAKRLAQLAKIRNFYAKEKGWDRGPHLFIDEKYIYLFTPMANIGIHAAEGNSTRVGGKLKYAIGVEVLGYYEKVVWPEAVAGNVGFAVATLQRRLKNFELRAGERWSDLNSHRQWNKPSCPGAAITASFYTKVCQEAAALLDTAGAVKALSVHPRLLGAWQQSGGIWLKDKLTPGLPTHAAAVGTDGLLYQRFERSIARIRNDGAVDWLLLGEIATLSAPAS